MAKPSKENPEKLFNFKVTPLTKFKLAIDALCDPEFNPKGNGVLEVTEKRVEITVRNSETKAAGYLCLNSTALKDFQFSSNCKDKLMLVNFRRIFQIITDADNNNNNNDDSITIFHINGSDNLTINLGNDPVTEFEVELLPMFTGFERFPDIIFFCEAIIPSDSLREIIDRLESVTNRLVSVDVTEKIVGVFIVDEEPWIYKYDDKIGGTRGMSPGQNHHAWFYWPHLQMLKKASHVAPAFPLCFLSEPKDMIMTRFTLRELGDLVFISETLMAIADSEKKSNESSSGSDGSNFEYIE